MGLYKILSTQGPVDREVTEWPHLPARDKTY